MILRLVNDAVWRTRVGYLWMLPIILVLWTITALNFGSAGRSVSLSLVLTYVFGPVAAVSTIGLREIRALPVTNRDLWKTTWVMSVIVIPAFLLFAQTLAVTLVLIFKGSSAVPPETLLLSTVYCGAYAGALLPVIPALGYASNNISSRRTRWLWILAAAGCGLVMAGGFGLPFVFQDSIPLTLGDLTTPWIAALALGFVVAGATWRWTPHRGGVARPPGSPGPAAGSSPSRRDLFADRFTGISRMALAQAAGVIVVTVVVAVGLLAYWAMFSSGSSLQAFLGSAGLLPFETSFRSIPDGPGFMISLFVFIAIAGPGLWNPLARQLKVLPLSVGAINRLFLVTSFALWAWVWLIAAIIHLAVIGSMPGQLRLDIFAAVWGLSALGNAMSLRLKGAGQSVWLLGAIGAGSNILGRFVGRRPETWVELTLTLVGIAALALAAFVNHRTLTRSTSTSKTYQRALHPWGASSMTSR
jgi:hypothetical protein